MCEVIETFEIKPNRFGSAGFYPISFCDIKEESGCTKLVGPSNASRSRREFDSGAGLITDVSMGYERNSIFDANVCIDSEVCLRAPNTTARNRANHSRFGKCEF